MKVIYTIHVKHDVGNQVELAACFKLLEAEAYSKKLMLYAMTENFQIYECGKPCGNSPLFKTTELDAVKQFIDQYE